MPVETSIDTEAGLVTYIATGTITIDEMKNAFKSVFEDPDFRPGMNALCHAKYASLDVSLNDVDELVELIRSFEAQRGAGYRVAILVQRNEDFGMTSLFEMKTFALPFEVRVFRNSDEAKQWLAEHSSHSSSGT